MFEYDFENEDKELKLVGLELMFLTPEKYSNPEGITAVELAKRVELDIDIVKKKLKILYDHDIIRCSGMNPKYWRFEKYISCFVLLMMWILTGILLINEYIGYC